MMHDQRTRRLRRSDQNTECLRSLHDRLVGQADAEHLLDIAHRTVDTPLGSLLVAATEVGLVRVAFEREDHDAVLAGKAGRAVGTACGHDLLPVIVPCHWVVRSDGSSGEYLGGASTRRALLDLEAQ